MAYDEFPDDVSLRFRLHVLCVYAQSTLTFIDRLVDDGPDNLDEESLKAIDNATVELERIWYEAVKIKRRARG